MAQDITALPALSSSSTLNNSAATMPPNKIPNVTKWHTRETKLDTDTMAICPDHPEFMVTGTWNLVRATELINSPRGQYRHGTIFVHSVNPLWQPDFPGNRPPVLASKKLPGAISDIHFHPVDKTLLAATASDMNVHFFRFAKRGDILSRRIITELIPLGTIQVAEREPETNAQIVPTQFCWFDLLNETGDPVKYTNNLTVALAITLASGDVITVKAKIPGIKSTFDPRLSRAPAAIAFSREIVHSHDLEAWFVTVLPLETSSDRQKVLLLSGADDCKLITSVVELNTNSHPTAHLLSAPAPFWTDSKFHTAGVVCILPLPPVLPVTTEPEPIPLLTGSYDETLRLFLLNPHTYRKQPLAPIEELRLELGGVWHVKLMDHYVVPLRRVTPPRPATPPTDPRQLPAPPPLPAHETHYVLIVANMHNGAQIVRVTHVPSPLKAQGTWTLQVACRLELEAHTSLVYDVEARKEWREVERLKVLDGAKNSEQVEKFEWAGVVSVGRWSEEWKVELEELMAKRRVKPLVIKTDVKWKDALLGEIEPLDKDGDVAEGKEGDGKAKRKVKGRGKSKKKRKGKGKRKEKKVDDNEKQDDDGNDEQAEEDEELEEVAETLEDFSMMTTYEKEQYDRGVGKYTCLSVGFYDSKLNTWEWVDTKRREGVGMREFLETA